MLLKITLDIAEAVPAELPEIQKFFQQWLIDFSLEEVAGSGVKVSDRGPRNKELYHAVRIGAEEIITVIQDLRERLHFSGVQIFIKVVDESDGRF